MVVPVMKWLLYGVAAIVVLSVLLGAVLLVIMGGALVCLFGVVALVTWILMELVESAWKRRRRQAKN